MVESATGPFVEFVVTSDGAWFESDIRFRDRGLVEQVPGARHDSRRQVWKIPNTWEHVVVLEAVFGDRLRVAGGTTAYPNNAAHLRNLLDASGDSDLFGYQRSGVAWLSDIRRGILTDEMGLGKSAVAIRTLTGLLKSGVDVLPALIVCPSSLRLNWARELEKWWPGLTVTVVSGSASLRRKQLETPSHIYVINYESVRLHSRLSAYGSIRLRHCHDCDISTRDDPKMTPARCERCPRELNNKQWATVIVDEAHRIKDPKAKQTRAVWSLPNPTSSVFALTGTPIANSIGDLWSLLHLVEPRAFSARSQFLDRYALMSYGVFGSLDVLGVKPERTNEFRALTEPRIRRLTKKEVLTQLPDKTYQVIPVEMTGVQLKTYNQMLKETLADLDGGRLVARSALAKVTRLLQFASASGWLDEDNVLQLAEPSNKIDAAIEIAGDLGKPLVIFAVSKKLINITDQALRRAKFKTGLITGDVSILDRQMTVDQFQRGELDVILLTVGAGGEGITLTRADTVLFMQRSWSNVQNLQAEDRVHRIGSEIHDKITIIDLVTADSVDWRVRERVAEKAEALDEITRDKERLRELVSGNVL